MALYHFSVGRISRSAGHSAIAAAAYRSGEKLYDEYYGEVQDYTRKGGVMESMILLPERAPDRLSDRQTLWHEVECQEKRKDAQLAYSFEFSLQNELTFDENKEIALKFINENFIARGMICDIAFHDPEREAGREPNPHVHVLVPIRPLDENGEWGSKRRHVPVFDEKGEPVLITSGKNKGKQKMDNPFTTDWGSAETLQLWRKNWEHTVNEKFKEKGLACRIDHRSNEAQGIERAPQVHEGSAVRRMEKRGMVTEKASWNRWIKKTFNTICCLIEKLRILAEWIKEVKAELQKEREPYIGEIISEYWANRDKVADTFERGRKKAKASNFKLITEMYSFAEGKNLKTISDVEELIKARNDELKDLKDGIRADRDEIAKHRMNIGLIDEYEKYKPVYDAGHRIFFSSRKKAYQEAHRTELGRFYKARRLLRELGKDETGLGVTRAYWSSIIDTLETRIRETTDKINDSPAGRDIKMLYKLKDAIDHYVKMHPSVAGDSEGPAKQKNAAERKVVNATADHGMGLKEQPGGTTEKQVRRDKNQLASRKEPAGERTVPRKRVSLKEKLAEKQKIVEENKAQRQAEIERGNRVPKKHRGQSL